MIKEAYCSFEVAKLLKEKEFDEECYTFYEYDSKEFYREERISCCNSRSDDYAAPTQQMAMRWLREVHNIHIVLMIENNGNYIGYLYDTKGNNIQGWDRRLSKTSYEEAIDAVIQYILENLM